VGGGISQVARFYNEKNKVGDAEYSVDSYTGNVERILQTLRRRGPKAAIAVFTIPPQGEDLNSDINALASHPTPRSQACSLSYELAKVFLVS
jgi:hypothetical protein